MTATLIAAHTRVTGSIRCEGDLVVAGRVDGDIEVEGVVRLLATAEVRGELHAARVIVDEGARLAGQVRLNRAVATILTTPIAAAQLPAARLVPELAVPGRRRVQRRQA